MNNYLDLSKEQFMAFLQFPAEGPLQMLNLLKFKPQLDSGLTGEAHYKIYMKAALPFIQQSQAKVLFYGAPQFTLIGPSEDLEWDKVLIVEYPNKAAFVNMITSEGYPADLRKAALENSRLIYCTPITF